MKELFLASLVFLSGCASLGGTAYDEIKTGMYRDGGTVWVALKEKRNDKIEMLCIDRRIGSKTRLEMFIGAIYPTDDAAKIVTGKERIEWIELLKKELQQDSKEHSPFIEVLDEHIKHKETEPVASGQRR